MDFELSLDYLLDKPIKPMGAVEVNNEPEFQPVISNSETEEFKFDKKGKKVINRLVSVQDITKDLADLKFSDDENAAQLDKVNEVEKPKKSRRNKARGKKDAERGDVNIKATKPSTPQNETTDDVNKDKPLSRRQKEKLRKQKKEQRLKQKEKQESKRENEEKNIQENNQQKNIQENAEDNKQKISENNQQKEKLNENATVDKEKSPFERSSSPEDPFSIKLKSVKVVHSNKKYTERLPKIPPIETIMGLSNDQIYKLNPSDIKLKRIVSQAGKLLGNIINFAMVNEEIFLNEETRTQFTVLCTNIAIFESRGLNKTLKIYPDIIETFSKYDELTLNHNKTKFTKSDKEIHQNNFDYSVLSYVGNIIIWLNSIHDLKISKKLIKGGFGGYHLWDQLFKEESINMKRWKHVIKFREEFPFQPNQFIVVMKFLHIEIS